VDAAGFVIPKQARSASLRNLEGSASTKLRNDSDHDGAPWRRLGDRNRSGVVAFDSESTAIVTVEVHQRRASRLLRNDRQGFLIDEPHGSTAYLFGLPLVFEKGRCGPHLPADS